MIRINLLPVRAARKKENIRQQVSMFFLFIVFVVCVMGYLTISMNRTISGLNDKIVVAQTELEKYQAIEKQVSKIKQELQKLEEKMDIIAQLEANRTGPVRFMDALTSLVLADKMWLTTLTETNGKMKLAGVATDNKTIADFMSRLEGSPDFTAVDLISSKQIAQQDRKLQAFTITCLVSSTRPEKAGGTS
jgi:type IV pilus assembly protein PilN